MRKLIYFSLLCVLLLTGCGKDCPSYTFIGAYDCLVDNNFEEIFTFTPIEGNRVTIASDYFQIEGTVSGAILSFDDSYMDGVDTILMVGAFTLTEDGATLSGSYTFNRLPNGPNFSVVTGTRI